jgi:hypothetical protein
MSWYVAEALFQSTIDEASPGYSPLVERSWFLVSADGEAAAHAKATDLAQAKRESYANADGENVRWAFLHIARLREVMDDLLTDGTEIWSLISRADEESGCTQIRP